MSKIVQYVTLNKATYNALPAKDDSALYFISDTNEIFRGTVHYSSLIIFYNDGERPTTGFSNKLYINKTTGQVSFYNNDTWIVLNPTASSSDLIDPKTMAGLAMPSDTYIDYPIQSGSGTNSVTITPEYDGYITFRAIAIGGFGSVELSTLQGASGDYGISQVSRTSFANDLVAATIPIKKGYAVRATVTSCNVQHLRLYKAFGQV